MFNIPHPLARDKALSEEGASTVYEVLQGRTFRCISWSVLFDWLSIYEDKFKQLLQRTGTILPEIQEGDAKALVAYLCVLRKACGDINLHLIDMNFTYWGAVFSHG